MADWIGHSATGRAILSSVRSAGTLSGTVPCTLASAGSKGKAHDSADRAPVRPDHSAPLRPSRQPPRVGDLARRSAVGRRACRRSASWRSGSGSAAPRSSAPIASSSRAGCCAATSAAARSSAPRPIRPARRSPGAARSRPRRCARATRRCATRSATRRTRASCRSRRASPRSTAFRSRPFQQALDHVLKRERLAVWRHGPTEGQPALREAIAERFGVPAESVLVLAGAQQGLDLLARCLIDPGDAVIVDRPGYLGAIQSFNAAGAKLIGWDVAQGGHGRARRRARALSPEADLHESHVPESRPA